ncbi:MULTISPECIES: hypothetical protein [Paraclostridium]|uniref:Bacteriocin n=1 Tax=Paraclostridium benzoelyticum TaxID=1629550 RepID=A0A0M3DDC6_9FIRM|nr:MULTISPECIES: hypothetical protein [Paraclostridium]MDV8114570.1 hypothetical protein [Bacillus sp. BAU-SS-2023]KKY00131.1 hypothetical protein VN21_15945 [Paraclostridium benzoelyticum]MCE9676701.1 hypothetical protein [Paraclostridium bifermentans]MDO7204642.1 hypothetical protein [Paraclostridium bifermentans]OXX83548.1 hypothetical protein AVM15_10225 [Paraclostridium benzoelyticum]
MNGKFEELNNLKLEEINGGFDFAEKVGSFLGDAVAKSMYKNCKKSLNRSRSVHIKRQSSFYKKKW